MLNYVLITATAKKKIFLPADSNLSGATGVREAEPQTKVTSSVRTVINKLQKFSNYSVTVIAYTAAGDGVKSAPIYCRTEEDGICRFIFQDCDIVGF